MGDLGHPIVLLQLYGLQRIRIPLFPQLCHLSFLNGRKGMVVIAVEGNRLETSDLFKDTPSLPHLTRNPVLESPASH